MHVCIFMRWHDSLMPGLFLQLYSYREWRVVASFPALGLGTRLAIGGLVGKVLFEHQKM